MNRNRDARWLRAFFQGIVVGAMPVAAGCHYVGPSSNTFVFAPVQPATGPGARPMTSEACQRACGVIADQCHYATLGPAPAQTAAPSPDMAGVSPPTMNWQQGREVIVCNQYEPGGFAFGSGRRPQGLAPREAPATDAGCELGAFFAARAYAEAASIAAFEILADELERHGAPRALTQRARAAAMDERAHADTMGALARRFGREPQRPVVGPARERSLEEIAIENAVEGCANETLGALVNTYQAVSAMDPEIREAYRVIAEDETHHAALSWSVQAWALRSLDGVARARLALAGREALHALETLELEPLSSFDASLVGLPDQATLRALSRPLRSLAGG
ncbi:MAG: ferritin-like domain-containing protein [Polyangiaceae bacterium]